MVVIRKILLQATRIIMEHSDDGQHAFVGCGPVIGRDRRGQWSIGELFLLIAEGKRGPSVLVGVAGHWVQTRCTELFYRSRRGA